VDEHNSMDQSQDQEQTPGEREAPGPLTTSELRARRRWFCCSSCAHRECDLLCGCPCHDPYGVDRAA
jgi:hypothetical protein